MPSLDDLSQAVSAYENREASLDEFADWFRAASRSKFAEDQAVLDAYLDIEAAFSELYYGGATEEKFREELAGAVRPFVRGPVYARAHKIVIGNRSPEAIETGTSTAPVAWVLVAVR
jgi:hypothetical protein